MRHHWLKANHAMGDLADYGILETMAKSLVDLLVIISICYRLLNGGYEP